ncbi:MAG TPA: hypothetical protein VKE22_19905 [Haliangiales bacterium]|nr:hypothetical protein [Haliangiales bacterium]
MSATFFLTLFLAASAQDDVRTQVEAYLGTIDTPIAADRWRALGPAAAPILEATARDGGAMPSRRARAVEALSFVGAPGAADLMIELARREGEPPIVRASALRGAGNLLPAARLVAAARPIMEGAADLHVRAAAAEVLARRAPREACSPVRAQVAREPSDRALAFSRALAACAATPER